MAAVVVSRLAAAGIVARIDRGLYGAYLAFPAGQIRVMVDEHAAHSARQILAEGTIPRR